jgi:hypothetical protein
MEETEDFSPVHVVPPGLAHLGFTYMKPKDWNEVAVPEQEGNIDDPKFCKALAICMAPYGLVVFTVAARPAYSDGCVQQWAEWLTKEQNIQIEYSTEAVVGQMPAVLVNGTQEAEVGKMRIRALFIEDGQRLFVIFACAPQQIWDSVEWHFDNMLATIRLDHVNGPTVPITADQKAPGGTEQQPPEERPAQPADAALANDSSSLDPDHPINARLLASGAGFVPKLEDTNPNERYAVVTASAIEASFRVPFGWHVLDDSKRTLIFDAPGKMQINLNLRPRMGMTDDQLLDELLEQYADQHELQHMKLTLGQYPALSLRNLKIDGETLQQAFLLRDSKTPGKLIVTRVTADDENMTLALNAAEVVLTHLKEIRHERPEAPDPNARPEWAQRSDKLEASGQYAEAEKTILEGCNHLGAYSSAAYVWEKAALKFKEEGKKEEMIQAYEKAKDLLWGYASGATSGGEGAALSYERDQRIRALEDALGLKRTV